MIERVSILDVKLIFRLPIQNAALIGRGNLYFIPGNFLTGLALVQFFFESFGFLFIFFGFLFQRGIACGFRGSTGFAERELIFDLIVSKICGDQATDKQNKGNRA